MDALSLSRLNTAVLLPAVGLVAGHLLMPVRGAPSWARAALFLLVMAALGALRGWREAMLREPPSRRPATLAAACAAGAVVLSVAGYLAFHGSPL